MPILPGRLRARGLATAAVLLLCCGCAAQLSTAQRSFYTGRYDKAQKAVEGEDYEGKDRVLLYMTRGTIRQALGDYAGSANDYITAYEHLEALETYSLSKGASSFVVNDNVQAFRGTPYERTLLHAFTAADHLALGHWEDAGVEARRIIASLKPEARGDYPEDAYSRYVAGFCLEMLDDYSNAALQYRKASELFPATEVNDQDGRLRERLKALPPPGGGPAEPAAWPVEKRPQELVCLVQLGRSPTGEDIWNRNFRPGSPRYAEIYHDGVLLGRSYTLSNTATLAAETADKQALKEAAKTVGRIAVKETIAQVTAHNYGDEWGDLVRFVLIGLLEKPDVRSWETLPHQLQVARVPCPPGLTSFEVVVKDPYGATVSKAIIDYPITRKGKTYFSLYRDLPSLPALPTVEEEGEATFVPPPSTQ